MAELDLDALRIARAEKQDELVLRFGGQRIKLPAELPYDTAMIMAEGDLMGALKDLMAEKDYERFVKERPSVDDITAIAEFLQAEYGKTMGESSASETS